MLKNIKRQPQLVFKKAIIPEAQIDEDLEQLGVNSDIKLKSEYNTELMPKTTQERVKIETVLKLRG
jgi:hypothetical protein